MSESPSGAVEAGAGGRRADGKRPNIFARIAIFVRQVISELGKVVTPTRSELGTYFVVVLVFLVITMAFVTLIDYLVGMGTLALFG